MPSGPPDASHLRRDWSLETGMLPARLSSAHEVMEKALKTEVRSIDTGFE